MSNGSPGLAIVLTLSLVASLAAAPVHGDQNRNGGNQSSATEISADRAAAAARSATGGRVLKVERRGNTYRVRVLLEGERVRDVRVDARTGRVLD